MGISISYNVSDSVLKKSNLKVADKHNERKYNLKSSEYSNSDINPEFTKFNKRLIGTKEIYKDVEKLYNSEFSDALQDYNSKQKRNDRKIYDYFENINTKKTSLYTEVIVQVGDKDYWKDKSIEEKKKMIEVFEKQLELSNEFFPNFKVVNAIIHLDETSPHMHIVGVPVSNKELALQVNEKKKKQKKQNGLDTYVCQSEIFTASNLKEFHQIFSEKSLQIFNEVYKTNEVLNDKQLHQEHLSLAEFKKVAPKIKENQKKYDELKEKSDKLEDNIKILKKEKTELDNLKVENTNLRENLKIENQKLKTVKDIKNKVIEKKGLLDKEVKVTLPKDEYNSLVAYAVKGEEFKNKLDKTLIEKDKEISSLKERVKFLERDNEEVSRELIDKTKEVRSLSSELHNYRYAKFLDKTPKINERYIEKLETIVPKETAKKLKEQATLEVNYNINDKGNEWER